MLVRGGHLPDKYPCFVFANGKKALYSRETDLKGCQVVESGFRFYRSPTEWIDVLPGDIVNGASIPWIFQWFYNPFDKRYRYSPDFHDLAVGENGQKKRKAFVNGEYRELTWKEAAEWFKDGLTIESDEEELQAVFYEAVMLKKRPRYWIRSLKK